MAMKWRTFSLLVLGATMSAASDAQEVEQIAPPATGSVGVITIPNGQAATVGTIGGETGATVTVLKSDSAQAALTQAIIAKLRARTLTPDEAWKSGALDVDDLLYIVGESLGPWGGFYWERDDDLRRALVKLLIEHGAERLQDTDKLSPALRLWLADYYWSVKDARVVPLAESILSEIKTPVKGGDALIFSAVERIAWYYRDTGQAEKSAQTWLRMKDYYTDSGWWIPDSLLEAARAYTEVGQNSKADELYTKVIDSNNTWVKAMALADKSRLLLLQHKTDEAITLLSYSLHGEEAEQGQIALNALLGYAYYQKGDFVLAHQITHETKISSQGFVSVSKLNGALDLIEDVSSAIDKWTKKPIDTEPGKLERDVSIHEIATGEVTRKFLIVSSRPLSLNLTTDNPNVSATLVGKWSTQSTNTVARYLQFQVDHVAEIHIKSEALHTKALNVVVTVTSPEISQFKATMPVAIHVIDN